MKERSNKSAIFNAFEGRVHALFNIAYLENAGHGELL